jgi:hypothetical protein
MPYLYIIDYQLIDMEIIDGIVSKPNKWRPLLARLINSMTRQEIAIHPGK